MENKAISQKEYLRKYMSSGDSDDKKKKKKKKKHKVGAKTVKIIDDDIDLKNMRPIKEGEFDIVLEGEDAPQIAGIIDERGPVNFSDKRRWKIITEEGDLTITKSGAPDAEGKNRDVEASVKRDKNDVDSTSSKSGHSRNKRSSPRRRSKDDDSDLSPPRQSKNNDWDLSPPRQSKNYDSDVSPPRRPTNSDSDLSPPRRSRNDDSDLSPPRQARHNESDLSPSRKRSKQNLDSHESGRNKRDKSDSSAFRRKEYRSRRDDLPRSSSRKNEKGYDHFDKSSSRSGKYDVSKSSDDKRGRQYDDRERKSRHSDISERRKRSRWDEEMDDYEHKRGERARARDSRMTKTLDGKTAGLQNAKALREETEAHKRREAEHFSKLSKEVSGVGQAPIVRDKTGKKRNFEAEAAEEREREVRQREIDEKYTRWGRGLKQIEDRQEKLKNDLREMSKPLARYADDADLDKELKEQEREGDPMLEYIKKKQIKEGKRKADPPKYEGSYAPNRFGIKPGYRWDGVDRSNGYEKKWFEAQNAKVARQEEAYKWSTADM